MRLLFFKRAYKEGAHEREKPTSKHTPIPSCPQVNASHPFMNHQNAKLKFALGEAAGKRFSVSICSPAGYLLDPSSDHVSEWEHSFPRPDSSESQNSKTNNVLILQTSACVYKLSI